MNDWVIQRAAIHLLLQPAIQEAQIRSLPLGFGEEGLKKSPGRFKKVGAAYSRQHQGERATGLMTSGQVPAGPSRQRFAGTRQPAAETSNGTRTGPVPVFPGTGLAVRYGRQRSPRGKICTCMIFMVKTDPDAIPMGMAC